MKAWRGLLGGVVVAAGVGVAGAQTPVLGSIEAPYANLQTSAKIASITWEPGAVAYGPVGTPLVLTGLNLGGIGTVQFVAYKNGTPDSNVTPVQATVTMWAPNMLIFTVPSGAKSGLVTVTTNEGKTSNNGLPFLVTPGTYAGTCPAGPTNTQLQITTASLHDGTIGQAYSATLSATGGTAAYTWSVASGSLPAGLTLNASTGTISGTPTGTPSSASVAFQVTDSSSPQLNNEALLSLTIESQTLAAGTIYSYTANSYDSVGNLTNYTDSIMGTWNMSAPGGGRGYDTLNRLMAADATWPDGTQLYFCWQYDAFGNRLQQENSPSSFQSGSGGANSCQPQSSATVATNLASYNTYNQITGTNARGVTATPTYDAAGDVTYDGVNYYSYDADGRVCATQSYTILGGIVAYGYLYDTNGTRIAKGSVTPSSNPATQPLSCDVTTNGFQFTENYALGPSGEELTTFGVANGTNTWQRTNVYEAGKLLATYDTAGLHFHLTDPLGTRRMQVSGNLSTIGQPETDIQSLPFGDQLNSYPDQFAPSTADDSTPLHFTGKERDAESGNDYFGARYYASSMGRFMSPDPSGLYYADQKNPQSLNLYAYAQNNPLINTDPSGEECVWDDGSYDAADDPDTGSADKCSGQGGTWVDPNLFENALLTNGQNANIQYGSWSGQANSTIASSWLGASSTTNSPFDNSISVSIPMAVWNWAALQTTPVSKWIWHYGNWAGPGGMGAPIDDVDAAAMQHDYCYHNGGFTAGSNYGGHSDGLQACNQALCDAASNAEAKALAPINAAAMNNQVPNDPGGHLMNEANAAADMIRYFSIVPFGNSCKGVNP